MKLLLVDPSTKFRKELQSRLRDIPTATVVAHASDETQAVIAAKLCKPDVVLTELNLGRGSGFAALAQLREDGFRGVAYAVTSADETEYGPQCIEHGIDGFYDKHLDLDCLVQSLMVLAYAPLGLGVARATPSGASQTA